MDERKRWLTEASRRLVCCGKRPQKNKTAIFKRYSRFKKGQYNIAALVLAGKLIRKKPLPNAPALYHKAANKVIIVDKPILDFPFQCELLNSRHGS